MFDLWCLLRPPPGWLWLPPKSSFVSSFIINSIKVRSFGGTGPQIAPLPPQSPNFSLCHNLLKCLPSPVISGLRTLLRSGEICLFYLQISSLPPSYPVPACPGCWPAAVAVASQYKISETILFMNHPIFRFKSQKRSDSVWWSTTCIKSLPINF